MRSLPINGLVLSGGHSRRMGQDKAAICIDDQPMLSHACQLLDPLCASVWVSARADQQDALRQRYPLITDQVTDGGPLAGIAAAQAHQPAAAWLVIACDMPRLQAATLQALVSVCDSVLQAGRQAVVIRNPQGQLEPLCALWLPASMPAVSAALAARQLAVGRLLESMSIHCIDCGDPEQLSNINQAADLARLAG